MAVPLFHSVKRNVQVLQREDLIPQLVSNLVQSWTEKRIFGEQWNLAPFRKLIAEWQISRQGPHLTLKKSNSKWVGEPDYKYHLNTTVCAGGMSFFQTNSWSVVL